MKTATQDKLAAVRWASKRNLRPAAVREIRVLLFKASHGLDVASVSKAESGWVGLPKQTFLLSTMDH